jgi:hypothetical protein
MSLREENAKSSGDLTHPLAPMEDNFMITPSISPPGLALSDDDRTISHPYPDTVDMLVALYSFHAFEPSQLTFDVGDVVKVLDRNADGPEWWKVQRVGDNAVGIVPSNYFVSTMHVADGFTPSPKAS